MSWKRGAYPEFTLEDVIATIFLLREPIGRKAIAETLDIGEGSVRTLLKKLNWIDVIDSAQRGHFLSKTGKNSLRGLRGYSRRHTSLGKSMECPPMLSSLKTRLSSRASS